MHKLPIRRISVPPQMTFVLRGVVKTSITPDVCEMNLSDFCWRPLLAQPLHCGAMHFCLSGLKPTSSRPSNRDALNWDTSDVPKVVDVAAPVYSFGAIPHRLVAKVPGSQLPSFLLHGSKDYGYRECTIKLSQIFTPH